jgi:hypothetical protein
LVQTRFIINKSHDPFYDLIIPEIILKNLSAVYCILCQLKFHTGIKIIRIQYAYNRLYYLRCLHDCNVSCWPLFLQQKTKQPKIFYVSGRNMSSWHIGLSVVATDVGGGFQMAGWFYDSGSWMLFTGLLGLVECRLPYSKG